MNEIQAIANFVSKKISKVRWRPTSKHVVQKPTIFASGSWDDNENELCLWHIEEVAAYDETEEMRIEDEPELLGKVAHKGDVTDLLFLEQDIIISASSTGEVSVYKFDQKQQTVTLHHNFGKVHQFSAGSVRNCPCTAVASRGDERIVSVGEDGCLNILALETARTRYDTAHRIEAADSCALNAACFLTHSEVAAVNAIGQFKIWDIRQPSVEPVRVFVPAGERVPLHCIDVHPTQPHIVAVGGQDGALSLWDMRQDRYPVTLVTAHSADMWEVHFHRTHPTHLFTCSNDGSLWHWDSSDMAAFNAAPALLTNTATASKGASSSSSTVSDAAAAANSWLLGDAARRHLVVKDLLSGASLLSVNSVDVSENCLVCGTDAEQICLIRNLAVV